MLDGAISASTAQLAMLLMSAFGGAIGSVLWINRQRDEVEAVARSLVSECDKRHHENATVLREQIDNLKLFYVRRDEIKEQEVRIMGRISELHVRAERQEAKLDTIGARVSELHPLVDLSRQNQDLLRELLGRHTRRDTGRDSHPSRDHAN